MANGTAKTLITPPPRWVFPNYSVRGWQWSWDGTQKLHVLFPSSQVSHKNIRMTLFPYQ